MLILLIFTIIGVQSSMQNSCANEYRESEIHFQVACTASFNRTVILMKIRIEIVSPPKYYYVKNKNINENCASLPKDNNAIITFVSAIIILAAGIVSLITVLNTRLGIQKEGKINYPLWITIRWTQNREKEVIEIKIFGNEIIKSETF